MSLTPSDALPASHRLIGTWRRFGVVGPVYEIIGISETKLNCHPTMRVRVVETGEELDYPVPAILKDPQEP